MQLDLSSKTSRPARRSRSVVRCPTIRCTFWIVVWSLFLLGLLGSFTFLERVWRVVIWVAGV